MRSASRTVRRAALSGVLALFLSAAATATLSPPASAAEGDIGHPGPAFSDAAGSPTGEKPESKLWFHAGSWWGSLLTADGSGYRIHRLDRSTQTWSDTGTALDSRPASRADVLWTGTSLYVASHLPAKSSAENAAGQPSRLFRYSWDATRSLWVLDAGYPTTISDHSSETLTIDRDSRGRLWATWTQDWQVRIVVSADGGRTWSAAGLPSADAKDLYPDDISALVSFSGGSTSSIGVMWSNQAKSAIFFAERRDDDAIGAWRVTRTAVQGPNSADDHVNLKSLQGDGSGRVFAVVKTSMDATGSASAPQNLLLARSPSTGDWTSTAVGTVAECHTRASLVIDVAQQRLHVFATAPTASGCPYPGYAGTIYHKTSALDAPSFPSGRGTPVIRDASTDGVNNVTTSKQSATSASGVVVLASDTTTRRYWHADLGAAEQPATQAAFTASTTSGVAPLQVQFTNSSTNATSYSWDFGDGTTSTAEHPAHTFAAGTWVVRLTATGPSGSSTASATVTASAPSPDAAPVASFTMSSSSGVMPLTARFTDTSSHEPTSWHWDFGNGQTSTQQHPSTTYRKPGNYTIRLTVRNAAGSSTATQSIKVWKK